ncbi:hypothetical protein KSP39_PZI005196 [Platanthera zijinensis]|uniref:25S rRNA (uridine-N(3))-methyltransferase BMT5-like domain-containing protein n=1 Tax=Platanthera zijinensis TaxID=2320716 RepID=A0AAP0BS11_9ASPA
MRATIIHEVDARQMRVHPKLRRRKFDRIVYNFPHAGFKGPEDSTKIPYKLSLCYITVYFCNSNVLFLI